MPVAAPAALRHAHDELALVDVGARARVAGQKLASGIFGSPVQLASGLPSLQPANDTWENRVEYDELAVESCFYVGNDPVNYVDRTGRLPTIAESGGTFWEFMDGVLEDWFGDDGSGSGGDGGDPANPGPYRRPPEDPYPDYSHCGGKAGVWKVRCCADACGVELDYGDGMDDVCPDSASERDTDCFLKCLGYLK